ncbi:hypothetical protein ACRAWD_28710 [Caulobacter segnis]
MTVQIPRAFDLGRLAPAAPDRAALCRRAGQPCGPRRTRPAVTATAARRHLICLDAGCAEPLGGPPIDVTAPDGL